MKKHAVSFFALTLLLTVSAAQAQNAPQSAGQATPTGHRIGLIDMSHVFQNYKKFEDLRGGLQAEIEQSDAEAKGMVEKLQKMQEEIKKFDAGSPEYELREKQLLDLKGEFDAFRAATQRRLARRESEMFKVVYTDVTAAVKLYAEYAKFDHVMRFNPKEIDDTTSPQEAVQTMNKTFLYTRPENDITETVLKYLNSQYAKAGATPVPGRTVSGSGGTPTRQ